MSSLAKCFEKLERDEAFHKNNLLNFVELVVRIMGELNEESIV